MKLLGRKMEKKHNESCVYLLERNLFFFLKIAISERKFRGLLKLL